jgi:hypothetical protein
LFIIRNLPMQKSASNKVDMKKKASSLKKADLDIRK